MLHKTVQEPIVLDPPDNVLNQETLTDKEIAEDFDGDKFH